MRFILTCLLIVCLGPELRAAVVPALLFGDNAVLQRDKPIPVWGTADAGEKVTVSFAGRTVTTMADATGAWRVDLPALPANATPADLVMTGTNTVTRTNILVGDVWLASGQSNMEMMVGESYDAPLDVPGSARYPMIRHLRVDYKVSDTPMRSGSGAWKVAGPETTGAFTAVGYYFALSLYEVLGVPVGIINNSRGASNIRAWVDPVTLETDSSIAKTAKWWALADRAQSTSPPVFAAIRSCLAKPYKGRLAAGSHGVRAPPTCGRLGPSWSLGRWEHLG